MLRPRNLFLFVASSPAPVQVARNAMATRFEIALHGDNAVVLRAAGEEALAEIDRLESQISLYRPTSERERTDVGFISFGDVF